MYHALSLASGVALGLYTQARTAIDSRGRGSFLAPGASAVHTREAGGAIKAPGRLAVASVLILVLLATPARMAPANAHRAADAPLDRIPLDHALYTTRFPSLYDGDPVALDDARSGRVLVLHRRKIGLADGPFTGISVLDALTGHIQRSFPLSGDDLAVDASTGRIFVKVANQVLQADSTTGRVLHTATVAAGTMPGFFSSDPSMLVSDGTLMVDARHRRVYSLSQIIDVPGDTLTQKWHIAVSVLDADTGDLIRTVAVGHQMYGDTCYTSCWLAIDPRRGRILVAVNSTSGGTGQNALFGIVDAQTGAVLRTLYPQSISGMAVVERTDRLYVVASSQDSLAVKLYVLDARTGSILPTSTDVLVGSLGVDERSGHVIELTQGTLAVLDGNTGHVLGMFVADEYLKRMAVNEYTGRIVVMSNTTIYIIDEHTATLLHTLTLPAHLAALAMDDQGDRIFVGQQEDPNRIPDGPTQLIVIDAASGTVLKRVALQSWGMMAVTSRARRVLVGSGAYDPTGMRFVRAPKIWTVGY